MYYITVHKFVPIKVCGGHAVFVVSDIIGDQTGFSKPVRIIWTNFENFSPRNASMPAFEFFSPKDLSV